jgi:DNA-binding NtrC family response regulator
MISTHAATATKVERRESAELNVLIVDDDRAARESCRQVVEELGFAAHVVPDALAAYDTLEQQPIDIVLLDLRSPDGNGMEVLREVKQRRPQAEVVLMTDFGTVQNAVQAMRFGAYDYLSKPFDRDELRLLLARVKGHIKILGENRVLRAKLRSKDGFANIVGASPQMEKLYRIISKVAVSNHPVLILGESGTGKELVARAIHSSGPNRDKPFLPVDCGTLVPTLIESELFGHVKGAFTGASRAKQGLLELAQGGTVFLDEIGELPIDLQSKLLRALQEKEIRPVGGTRRIPINARVLAASNRDLETACETGTFRKDLYFRLNVVNLRIPPLRERKSDIPLLVGKFLERLSKETSMGRPAVDRTISDNALQRLMGYEWPGNVRELENCLERACALSSGPIVHLGDLPTALQNAEMFAAPPLPAANGPAIVPIAELEKQTILSTIRVLNGDKLEAARRLGIGKTTLYRKLKEYGTQF